MIYKIFSKKPLDEKIEAKFKKINNNQQTDIIFSFGGDGTFLHCVHENQELIDNARFVGINTGHLGFYSEYNLEELDELISDVNNGNYQTSKYSLLDIEIKDQNGKNKALALNEVVISNPIQTISIDVYLDGYFLETFRGTGLLVSTNTGSTAYNKSSGGSVVDPRIDSIQLTEVAGINNRIYKTLNSSLILNKDAVIKLVVKNDSNTYICIDGLSHEENNVDEVIIKVSDKKLNCISKQNNYYEKLKNTFIK